MVNASPLRVAQTRGSERWGARLAKCCSAWHCISTKDCSLAGCMIFRTNSRPSAEVEMEIVVVLAGKRLGGDIEAENFARQAHRFRFGDRRGHARFGNHARNLIRKDWSASILAGFAMREELNTKYESRHDREVQHQISDAGRKHGGKMPALHFFAGGLDRNRPVHRRKTDHGRRAAIFDAAIVVVPGFPRVIANAGAAAHRRIVA